MGTKKILIVEDNQILRELCNEFLVVDGFDVCAAKNGKEALEIYKRNGIDLVLMDLKIPVMDGFEALKQLKFIRANLPVIALTGKATDEDKYKCKQAGFDDILIKPYEGDRLAAVINKNLPHS
jgi:CheY-like chemotaxis protein